MTRKAASIGVFPVLLAIPAMSALAGCVVLAYNGCPIWATLVGIASLAMSIPFLGWLLAGTYLQADIVAALKKNGGSMTRNELSIFVLPGDDRFVRTLEQKGVLSIQGDVVRLNEKRLGLRLDLFVRVAEGPRKRSRGREE